MCLHIYLCVYAIELFYKMISPPKHGTDLCGHVKIAVDVGSDIAN